MLNGWQRGTNSTKRHFSIFRNFDKNLKIWKDAPQSVNYSPPGLDAHRCPLTFHKVSARHYLNSEKKLWKCIKNSKMKKRFFWLFSKFMKDTKFLSTPSDSTSKITYRKNLLARFSNFLHTFFSKNHFFHFHHFFRPRGTYNVITRFVGPIGKNRLGFFLVTICTFDP